jgi:hypothetical protein
VGSEMKRESRVISSGDWMVCLTALLRSSLMQARRRLSLVHPVAVHPRREQLKLVDARFTVPLHVVQNGVAVAYYLQWCSWVL